MHRFTFKGEQAVLVEAQRVNHCYLFESLQRENGQETRQEFVVAIQTNDSEVVQTTFFNPEDHNKLGLFEQSQLFSLARYTFDIIHQQSNPWVWV